MKATKWKEEIGQIDFIFQLVYFSGPVHFVNLKMEAVRGKIFKGMEAGVRASLLGEETRRPFRLSWDRKGLF